jgi:hypothetical protein
LPDGPIDTLLKRTGVGVGCTSSTELIVLH